MDSFWPDNAPQNTLAATKEMPRDKWPAEFFLHTGGELQLFLAHTFFLLDGAAAAANYYYCFIRLSDPSCLSAKYSWTHVRLRYCLRFCQLIFTAPELNWFLNCCADTLYLCGWRWKISRLSRQSE